MLNLTFFMQIKMNWNKIKYSLFFYVGASILYFSLRIILKREIIIAAPLSSAFHWKYPNTLIGLFTFALYITMYLFKPIKKDTFWFYIKFYSIWLEISVFFSILFWAYIGYYPDIVLAVNRIVDDFWNMFITANGIIILSFPYNITVLLLSFLLIRKYIKHTSL